jgi:hypothetical protein
MSYTFAFGLAVLAVPAAPVEVFHDPPYNRAPPACALPVPDAAMVGSEYSLTDVIEPGVVPVGTPIMRSHGWLRFGVEAWF